MIRTTTLAALTILALFAGFSTAQIVEPKGTVQNFNDIESFSPMEGITVRSVVGDTVRFSRIEAVEGATSPNHNHANEQFVFLLSGSLRCLVGDDEYILVPGDVAVFPAWVPHNLTALEDSVWFESHGAGF